MIICHQYKFIFLKTRKTAGTSLEIALSRFCNENDVVTEIIEEELRKDEGGRVGKNPKKPFSQYSAKDIIRLLLPNKPTPILFFNHVPASRVKNNISSEIWNNYFKFTIERNPWDKAISLLYYFKKNKFSLSEDLHKFAHYYPNLLSNWNIYTIQDSIAVDRVLFYEHLTSDLSKLADDLGLGGLTLPIKKTKDNFRTNKSDYKEILSKDDADLIKTVCQREIETFGYQF